VSLTLAVASGKGGTGKTTLAVHLAAWYARSGPTLLADLDVDAPDAGGYFPAARPVAPDQPVEIAVPEQDQARCTACGACASLCRFGALVYIKGMVTINPVTCKGCGRCVRACPAGALVESPVRAGRVSLALLPNLALYQGLLTVGDIRSTAVIEAVKQRAVDPAAALTIRDCPPGATCPTVRAVHGASACLLVAEPTAFSLHDLENALRLVQALGIPVGLVINKAGAGQADPRRLAARYAVPVVAKLAWSHSLAEAGARGQLCLEDPAMRRCLGDIELWLDGFKPKDAP